MKEKRIHEEWKEKKWQCAALLLPNITKGYLLAYMPGIAMKVVGKISAERPSAAPRGSAQQAGADPAARPSVRCIPGCNMLAGFQSRGFQTQVPESLETEQGWYFEIKLLYVYTREELFQWHNTLLCCRVALEIQRKHKPLSWPENIPHGYLH